MLLELDNPITGFAARPSRVPAERRPEWSMLVPFFNERDYLPATIASLARQSLPVTVILIDNGSTDGSAAIAKAACERLGLDYLLIAEPRPGKVEALKSGLRWVRTRFVATCDADTLYPPHYLVHAQRLLETGDCVVAGAFFAAEDLPAADRIKAGRKMVAVARLLPRQCHTGGAGQAFRTDALRAAGGFDATRWGYVLEDHEVIHRVMKLGTMAYGAGFWCSPSPRERDRESIRWTLVERLLYSATAPWAGDWFFYRFLAKRLRTRRLTSERIRERPFQEVGRMTGAALDPVCG